VSECTFTGNQTGQGATTPASGVPGAGGGAVLTAHNTFDVWMINSTFESNAAREGGGLQLSSSPNLGATGDIVVVGSVFRANTASVYGGGLAYRGDGEGAFLVANCTFEGNTATLTGGGIQYLGYDQRGSDPHRLVGNILWNDSAPAGAEIGSADSPMVTEVLIAVDENDIQGGCDASPTSLLACGSNLDVDPSFVNAGAGNLALQPGSPVQHQGDATALPADVADLDGDNDTAEATPYDRAGNPRVVGADVDMGAYELQ
jgi:hypothetical protein